MQRSFSKSYFRSVRLREFGFATCVTEAIVLKVEIASVARDEGAVFLWFQEATKYVKEKLLNRIVFVRLLSKDQYGRIVAQVLVPCTSLGTYTSMKSTPSLNGVKRKWCPLWCWNRRANALKLTEKERHEWCEDICQDLLIEGLALVYR